MRYCRANAAGAGPKKGGIKEFLGLTSKRRDDCGENALAGSGAVEKRPREANRL